MTQQGVRWTTDQVLALAPDASSRKAGSRLGVAGPWSETGSSTEGAVWGLCKGSGSKPYQTIVDTGGTGPAYKCSCPSRKFPCKHALGLLLLWAADDAHVPPEQTPPEWTEQWLESRKKRTQPRPPNPEAATTSTTATNHEAAQRRAERRAQRITAGATELEQRLTDLLRGGLAQAEQAGYGLWEETAARMVDAQAPGLAARVRELGTIPASGPGWPMRLLEECALLHLLTQAWQNRATLPEDLATTVRTRIGLPATPITTPLRDHWLILSQYDTADGHLTTRRIWLHGERTNRTALLLSFGAAGRAPSLALPTGLTLDADIAPHPGAGVLRADLGTHHTPPAPTTTRPEGKRIAQALTAYGQALTTDPWLESWPMTLTNVIPIRTEDGHVWQLMDATDKTALPVPTRTPSPPDLWRLMALSGGAPLTVFGECGHKGFTPLSAWTHQSPEVISLH
ncbi:SWIM zinc finger family protein [Streptomyces sp. NPDC016845]|uniref:SWIM zinc finger family protein n=1 Tax=Streptomyces sp. NPDC016845 TaxID=3364972 RepID=UPI0037939619